ncbi:DNA ligase [Photobacterium sp. DNB23_23_1]|uniref:DNA ligase n=1 Tax=Photobacterium pectinilyticum TaxID=2906793 RepID=A0ABT1N3W2_9GAMM|nr:DNA ligase [Photobacterium sp. ZSDE20]MCQ1059237.1 DNA ligase [Photobacterium sp. ZSDE20]MDD1824530.1 DNA ligase [Photobacterium sp. ZSDE20]
MNPPLFPPRIQLSSLSSMILFAISPFNPVFASTAISQELMHASSMNIETLAFNNDIKDQLQHYFASEKLDGIRAIWTGTSLVTRQGNPIIAPLWFIDALPNNIWLEGELWVGHQQFQLVSSIVRDQQPNEKEWQKVKFMVFDSPSMTTPFEARLKTLEMHIQSINQPHIQLVPQYEITHVSELEHLQDTIEAKNGEGVMLHRKDNLYQPGRNNQLIKLKTYQDSEAVVVGYEPGKGKYHGQMGAVWVVTPENKKFKIGTGFSDHDRQSPPPLGSIIHYRFNGFTDSGIPRFARYLRVRNSPDS